MEIVLATHNKNKVFEMQNFLSEILGGEKILTATDVGILDIEEDGKTFEENALIKVNAVWKEGRIAIADDSGLCVNCLNGQPGVYSARYAGEPTDNEKNNQKLLQNMKDSKDRSAYFVCSIACKLQDGSEFTVTGKANGEILYEYRGEAGFGYDPLFFVPSVQKTFAELTKEEKNQISHRGNAMRLLKEELSKRLK